MKMKILKLLAMLCMVAAINAVATSCKDDDDDDDNSENSLLISTWRWSEDGDWEEYTFNSNGTYTCVYYEYGKGQDTETGTYTYNHPTLTLKYDGDTEVYTVKSISDTQLILEDDYENETYIYTNCKNGDDNQNSQLVGTWRDSYSDGWDEITFKSNGQYTWVTYENGKGQDTESGTYTYNHPTLTLKYDGVTDVYTVKSVSSTKLVINSEGEDWTYTKK